MTLTVCVNICYMYIDRRMFKDSVVETLNMAVVQAQKCTAPLLFLSLSLVGSIPRVGTPDGLKSPGQRGRSFPSTSHYSYTKRVNEKGFG